MSYLHCLARHVGMFTSRIVAPLSVWTLFVFLSNPLSAALPTGFVINGDGTFVYTDPDTANGPGPNGSHDNSFNGVILTPAGTGPFPAIIINHGQGGSVSNYSQPVAEDMVPWGLVAICPTLTHRGGAGIDDTGAGSGDSPANRERGQICYAALLALSNVDPDRIAIWGHSKGAYATIGMAAVIGSGLKAGGFSAGGCTIGGNSEMQAAPTDTQADPVVTPFLMFHGTVDPSVSPAFSENFVDVLDGNGIPNDRITFDTSGLSGNLQHNLHQTPEFYDAMLSGFHDWLVTCGVLTSSPVTLLSEDFEANFNNWTDGGATDWDRTSAQKHAGSFSAHAGATDNDLISDNLDTSGYSSITIDFWYRDDDIDDDDDIYLQLFDGTSYDNRLELGLGTEDTWQHATITLNNSGADAQYFHANFRLKFEGTSIDSGENLWIDDVTVTAQ